MQKKAVKTTPEFQRQATQAIFAIVFFILCYFVLLALAIALTVLCILAGLGLMAVHLSFITIVLGIGLASLGILVLIFLLKFTFKSHKTDLSHLLEITAQDEPELFRLIQEVVQEVDTNFPKRVYLSPNVNAAVFYDSSFWSMFFPIKKNLEIGLGLVNTVTKDELRAILAHEFGHFSQKTMKVGSYVYNVNQVIFNLLYDTEDYDAMVHKWASVSAYFGLFVALAIKIITGIQWILRKLYDVVNKRYLALSREMEFNADEIAASVTGYEPLKNALLRMRLSDQAFDEVLSFYQGKISENYKSPNVYDEQTYVLHFLAKDNDLPIENQLPVVNLEVLNKFNKSKLVFKDQWASHPSTEERIARLEQTGLHAESLSNSPANSVFKDITATQKAVTDKIFGNVEYQGPISTFSVEGFRSEFEKANADAAFPAIYNGYYDHNNARPFDVSKDYPVEPAWDLATLFADEQVEQIYVMIALSNDIEAIQKIEQKAITVNTFDYDGQKYNWKDIGTLLPTLTAELEQAKEQALQHDQRIFGFFQKQEQTQQKPPQLATLYQSMFEYANGYEAKFGIYTQLASQLEFLSVVTPYEAIVRNLAQAAQTEKQLKVELQAMLDGALHQPEITPEMRKNLELYCSKDLQYFANEKYDQDNLEILSNAMNSYTFLLVRGYIRLKRQLLSYQASLAA